MNIRAKSICGWVGILSMACLAGLFVGCDDSDYDHDVPEGEASLVVDNFTGDRVYVYIDGVEVDSVTADKHRYYDLEPGEHRVALDGDDTDRSWFGDVDVLEDRLTVMEVRGEIGYTDEFDVEIYLD